MISRRDALTVCRLTELWPNTGPAVCCWEGAQGLLQPVGLMKHSSGVSEGRLEGNEMMREQSISEFKL